MASNRRGGLAALLHPEDIGRQMFAADVLQFLETKLVRQIGAEPLERIVVTLLGKE